MGISRKILITEPLNFSNVANSAMKIRELFNVGLSVEENKIITNNNFELAQNGQINKKFISLIREDSQTLPILKETYEYSSNLSLQTFGEWNEFVSSSLSVNVSSDHYTLLNGQYDDLDAYYLGIKQALYSTNINYEYNFLIESYEQAISQPLLNEKLLPNMYVIMFAKNEQQVTGQQTKFNNIITLNNRINSTQTYSLQNKALTNLNPSGEYHDLYANVVANFGRNFNISSLNNISNTMTNIVVAPEQLSYINQMSEYKELYPMYNEINITMDKFSSFSTLLKDSNLTLSLINYVINNTGSQTNFTYNEESVAYSFNVNTDYSFEINNQIANRGIIATLTSSAETKAVSTYDILDWWQKTKQDFTPSETNNTNTLVLGIDDESLKITQKDYEFARSISYLIFYGKLRKMVEQTQRNFAQTIGAEPAYSETVFYKINKYKSGSTTPIQTFWIPNSANLDTFKFIDTQVKYNTEYEYKIFAYNIVVGNSITTNVLSSINETNRNPQSAQTVFSALSNISTTSTALNTANTNKFYSTIEYINTPLVTLVEVPIYSKSNKIVDDPPLKPEVLIVPNKNVNNKIKFYFNNSVGEETSTFINVNLNDDQQLKKTKTMYVEIPNTKIKFKADDIASSFEIFRITKKPEFYSDFSNNLIASVTTDYNKKSFIKASSASYVDRILPNTKYYYIFRSIDYHGNYSNPTDVYEIEMVDDEGAVYLRTNIINLNEENKITKQDKFFKKLFYIKPQILQTLINPDAVKDIKEAYDIFNLGDYNILGQADSPVWNKKFKIRFVSKKTGKMFDLNLDLDVEIDKENL